MKRLATLLTIFTTLCIGACSSDSSMQEATGKGTVRAINAIESSPDIGFLNEEIPISSVTFQNASSFKEWDDLVYDFNFEVLFAGDTSVTRFATQNLDVVADRDYTFLVSGSLTAPVITVWDAPEATFGANATNFEMRFGHASPNLGRVDYYFALEGVAPIAGQSVATLAFGEQADAVSFEAGDYVLTLTTAGDPNDVLYTSNAVTFAALSELIVVPFDGDANNTTPTFVRAFNTNGTALLMPDLSFPSTVEILHASVDLGAVDVYDDAALQSQVLNNLAFGSRSAELALSSGDTTFRVTPAGDTANVTLENTITTTSGLRFRLALLGTAGNYSAFSYFPDRRPIDTAAKILILNTSSNFPSVDLYIVTAGVPIDGQVRFRESIASGQPVPVAGIAAGSYDVYVANAGTTDILSGPLRIDVSLADVLDLVFIDNIDPAIVDIQILP